MRKPWLVAPLFGAAVAIATSGCASRRHMTEGHGRSLGQAFRVQHAYAAPPVTGPQPAGLDPDEAQIVYDSYRRTIGAKGGNQKPAPSGIIIAEDSDEKKNASQ